MPKQYKIGDLVWAKIKNCSPWPSRVTVPLQNVKKTKKNATFVYFFGTHDHSWVDPDNIKPYIEYKHILGTSSKNSSFKKAVAEIEDYIEKRNSDPNFDPEKENELDSEFNRLKEEENEKSEKSEKIEKAGTSKKRKMSSGTKRNSESGKTSVSKKRKSSPTAENGASSSYSSSVLTRNFEEILNRPTIMDVPSSPTIDINNVSDALKSKYIEPSNLTFGFLGLGIMGSGIVKNLINSGHRVNLWNRSSRKAEDIKSQSELNHAGYVETYSAPCDVVENSDIIFCCVSDVVAVKDIVYGNCGLMHNRETLDGKGYVEMTSIDSETSLDICNFITKNGGRYLEAQLQGSKQEAHDANLIVLGAGDEGLFNQCQSCFKAIGRTVFYLGNVGFATKMNLVLQVIKGVALAGLAEAFALADRSGIAPRDVLEVFSLTAIANPFLKRKAELIVSTDFQNVEQPLMHMQKDTKLALQLADSLRQPLLMTAAANEIYKHTRRFGCDSHDAASVYMRARH